MGGIGDQVLAARVHHEIKRLQGHLPEKIGHRLRHFNHVEVPVPAHHLKAYRLVFVADDVAVGRP
jgi:hypothetical protein